MKPLRTLPLAAICCLAPITGVADDTKIYPISQLSTPNPQGLNVSYLDQCFAKIQNHKLHGLVVQGAVVHLPVGRKYKLIKGSGTIQGTTFFPDHYGLNLIQSSSGQTYKIMNHFSSTKIAGGDEQKLKGMKINRIQDFADLMRFHPDVGKTDPQGPMAKGPHTTVEPRIFVDSRGIFYCSYHVKDHTFRSDAATGMGLVVSVSFDQGNTWQDTWYENHRNGVLGYPAFCEYEGKVHLYFNGSHWRNPSKRHWQGVQRITTTDGKNWSPMERIDNLNILFTKKPDGTAIPITHNALTIPKMEWKGQRGTAILLPHYAGYIVISMDGGTTWDVFFKGDNYDSKKPNANLMDELTLELTKDRQVYVISRIMKEKKLKYEYLIGLDGQLIKRWQQNFLARWCSHGTEKLPDGRFLYTTNNGNHRECAAIAISNTPDPTDGFVTKQLFINGGWGYSDGCFSPADNALLVVGECEPMIDGQFLDMPAHFMGGNDNERLSIRLFKMSMLYFDKALPLAPEGEIPYTDRVRQK